MKAIAAQLSEAREALGAVAGSNAALEARVLAAHAWGMTPEALVLHSAEPRDQAALGDLLERRLRHEPVAQILGTKDFWKQTFTVTRDVLTPRADSETMIEELLRLRTDKAAPLRILDLGTGSGCLLLSTLGEYPNASGVGVDASEAALAVATKNAAALGLGTRAALQCSNWCSNVEGTFDVVLSNPPYIPRAEIATLDTDVQGFEPHSALDGGVDGLDCYRAISAQILPHLNPGALLLFEVGAGQADDVAALGVAHGLTLISITSDLAGIPRIVAFQYSI
jgi:release factor glutamine methyltransferase